MQNVSIFLHVVFIFSIYDDSIIVFRTTKNDCVDVIKKIRLCCEFFNAISVLFFCMVSIYYNDDG